MATAVAVKIAPEPTYGLARRSNTRARPTMHEDHPDLDERGLQALQDALDSLNRRDALPEVRAWLDAGGDPNAFLGSYGPTPKSILSVALSYGRVEVRSRPASTHHDARHDGASLLGSASRKNFQFTIPTHRTPSPNCLRTSYPTPSTAPGRRPRCTSRRSSG